MRWLIKQFDTIIYRLFYWRWNRKLEKNDGLRKLFLYHLNEYDMKVKNDDN